VGDTKIPNVSLMTHGSVATDGVSVLGRQSPLHAWEPALQLTPHAGVAPLQVAMPCPDGGAAHLVVHEPQWFGSVGA
jgi:hypothetical protein